LCPTRVDETDNDAEEVVVLVACLGDIMLDVLVATPGGLVPDDDTPATITFAAGGQAANIASWVVALGGNARVFGPRADNGPGRLVEQVLAQSRVEVHGPAVARPGAVMSLVADGYRSLASDPGDSRWLDDVEVGPWLEDADWLLVSGYAMLRTGQPERIVDVVLAARSAGTRIAVDLSSASMITRYGAARFRRLWQSLAPSVVFANDREWDATNAESDGERRSGGGTGGTSVLVLKHGAEGSTFVIDGIADDRSPIPGEVVDVTGAGDALAAGYLVGGVDMAMQAAAACVAQVGAQPALSSGRLL
jgi:ribokinase